MDTKSLVIGVSTLLLFCQSFAASITVVDDSSIETQATENLHEEKQHVIVSETEIYSFIKTSYSNPELDQHALRIAANCQPLNTKGMIGLAAVSLDDSYYIIPTKPSSLPPHPGEKGNEGIHGIDVNQNCVRDDIEHYIFSKYKKEDQEQLRKYLFEHVIWLNFFLISNISTESIQAVSRQSIKTSLCINKTIGSSEAKLILDSVFGQVHNTEQRTYRFFANSKVLSGWLIEESIPSSC